MRTLFAICSILGVLCNTNLGYALPTDSSEAGSFAVAGKQNSMAIDPKYRAADYKEVFEFLRKEKAPNKVCVKLIDGSTVSNIIDMNLMANNTVFLLRYNTPKGIKVQAVELEHIQGIGYLE